MRNKVALLGFSYLIVTFPALAQQATNLAMPAPSTASVVSTPVQPIAVIEAPTTQNILRAGTEVPLVTREELTTKKKQLRVGQRFQMEVASNVTSGGVVVIPAGTPAVGEITEVRNKGMWGKSGYIGARAMSLRLGDRHIRISGTFDDKGVTGTGGVVASVALLPLAGFFTTGTSAFVASGASVKGFLDEDIVFRTVAAQPQMIDVPVTASAPTVQTIPAATAQPAAPAGN